ncbi:hypothetical protein [Phaeodactylibacter luteus]|uniref:DUF4974 domain-containing protein n=1 Tax=Phaeodactylibacter luteus TaxID=1564516 RepID=A0A5C6RIK7_9BACT|nr:hypothetical protein [Phaeodactylibacter luteus]TXB62236.1 hypothetical protein FRY97_14950 [Phaeodactylibacter luteus]
MIKKSCLLLAHLIAVSLTVEAGTAGGPEPLRTVLRSLEQAHQVHFSYSPDLIPLEREVQPPAVGESLEAAMDELCRQLPLRYMISGKQVWLRPGAGELGQLAPKVPQPRQKSPIYPLSPAEEAERQRLASIMKPIGKTAPRPLNRPGGEAYQEIDFEIYLPPPPASPANGEQVYKGDRRLAQVSILPNLGTNMERSGEITNHLSVNVLWGTNGGVDGLEVGGLYNEVINDVNGLQVAGLGSKVNGRVSGTQVAGLFNVGYGNVQGVQAAGLFNQAGQADAVQAAGLFNHSAGAFTGVQVAGAFNIIEGQGAGVQVAGLFNRADQQIQSQVAGLFNTAGNVAGGQAAPLFNKADTVAGFQVGLINISDTITGVPVGLINIVRHGYNRVDFSTGEALHANLALKLGARKFYNIFQAGLRLSDCPWQLGSGQYSWALGYGLGSIKDYGPHFQVNYELVAMQVSEGASGWGNRLNMLNQFRALGGFHGAGRRTVVYAGPVLNVTVAGQRGGDAADEGLRAPYSVWSRTGDRVALNAWVGFQAGLAF